MGYGLAGRVFHGPLISTTRGLTLSAIVTSDRERAAQARSDHPGCDILPSVDEVWARAREIDLVVVASANRAHVPQARAALNAGLHVVVDKPLAATADEARSLAAQADSVDRSLHVFQNRRWDSDFLTLRQLAGDLGFVHRLESRIERWRPDERGVWRESADPQDMGGQLFDLGAHAIDQAIQLLGPVTQVSGRPSRLRNPVHADDDAIVVLGHESGSTSVISVSAVTAIPGPRFRAMGTDGGVVIEQSDSQEDALREGRTPADPDWGAEPASAAARVVRRDGREERMPLARGRWQDYYDGVRASIVDGAPAPVDTRDVISNLRVIEAARRGGTVELSPPARHA